MEYKVYEEIFSGHYLRYAFQYPGTELYMIPYIRRVEGDDYNILASLEYIDEHKPYYIESTDDRYVEYKSLIGLTALEMLRFDCFIMHAVAFLMDGICWLIAAPSGTGKSTQYFNLKKLYGDKVEMICGDMPLLSKDSEGNILVRPSPWNGKERIKGRKYAPLGGILYLKQGPENCIRKLNHTEAVLPVLTQLAAMPDTEDQVLQLTAFTEELIQRYPVWEMVNLGDMESSRLAAQTFHDYIKDINHEI